MSSPLVPSLVIQAYRKATGAPQAHYPPPPPMSTLLPFSIPRLASTTVDGTTLVQYDEIRSLRGLRGVRVLAVKSFPCIVRSFFCLIFL